MAHLYLGVSLRGSASRRPARNACRRSGRHAPASRRSRDIYSALKDEGRLPKLHDDVFGKLAGESKSCEAGAREGERMIRLPDWSGVARSLLR